MFSSYISILGSESFKHLTILSCIYLLFFIYYFFILRKKEQGRQNEVLKSLGLLFSGGIFIIFILIISFSIRYFNLSKIVIDYIYLVGFMIMGGFMGIFNLIYKKKINDWVYYKFGMIGLYTSIIIFIFLVATYFK